MSSKVKGPALGWGNWLVSGSHPPRGFWDSRFKHTGPLPQASAGAAQVPPPGLHGARTEQGLSVLRPHPLDGPSTPPAHPGDVCVLGNSSAPRRKAALLPGANTHLLVVRGAVFQGGDRHTTLVCPDWDPRSRSLTGTGLQDVT